MPLARTYSAQPAGLRGHIITVEVDLFRGFHAFSVVGLPDKAVEESRDRINSAIKSTGLTAPKESGQQKITVALAPADIKKEGPLFDVSIALAYLHAADEIRFDATGKLFLGELSLSGDIRPVRGALALAQAAREAGFTELFVPKENAREAAFVRGITIYGVRTLAELVAHLNTKRINEHQRTRLALARKPLAAQTETAFAPEETSAPVRLEDIRGQHHAKRGLEIAAAGGHNIAFYGPPGTGKTLLAKALIGLLPPLSFEEALEVTGIHSLAGALAGDIIGTPPFRAPHHTASHTAIIGGGAIPRPGEATLAHRGVLFLDEFPEFDRRVIESLRQPLEDGVVHVARVRGNERFPANFILAAALNPCPCGYYGDRERQCSCTHSQLVRYRRKLSGPIIDRIDVWIEVPRIDYADLAPRAQKDTRNTAETDRLRRNIVRARQRMHDRQGEVLNSAIDARMLNSVGKLDAQAATDLNTAARSLTLSPRAYHRVIKIARTIADINGEDIIKAPHIHEAVQYRPKNIEE